MGVNGEDMQCFHLVLPISGRSSASLVIRPNRTQHFTTASLSLSCEVQDNSTGWRLRWFTKREEISECPSLWTTAAGPRCSTAQLLPSDSGVYWCQSDCKYSHIVNITVHSKKSTYLLYNVYPQFNSLYLNSVSKRIVFPYLLV